MKHQFRSFLQLATVASLVSTAGYLIAPIEVRFLSSLTNSSVLIGLTYALGMVAFGLFSIWLGRLSDRKGRWWFILLGCVLGICFSLVYATAINIYQYMGGRFIWAFSSATTGPLIMAALQQSMSKLSNKGSMIGIVYGVQSIAGAAAAYAGGLLTDRFSFMVPYIVMGVLFALATVLALSLPKLALPKRQKQQARSLLFSVQYVLKKPALRFYALLNAAFSLNWGIKAMLWPLIIYGMVANDQTTGAIFATMGIVAFFTLLRVGKIVDHIGPFRSGRWSMLLLGASGLILVFTSDYRIFWIAAAIFAIGEALYGPTQAVLLTEHVEDNVRGELLGLDAVSDTVLNSLAPFLAGLLLVAWQPQAVLALFIACLWAALIGSRSIHLDTAK